MLTDEDPYIKAKQSISPEIREAIQSTFDLNAEKLPSRKVLIPVLEHKGKPFDIFSRPGDMTWLSAYMIRDLYLENAFVAYNDEMLTALKKFCDSKNMKKVHELCCGTGWFSHWMKKYGVPLDKAVDDKTWGTYKRDDKFLPMVTEEDAVRFVKKNGDADMFVVSWPYMNDLCYRIWKNMKPGQYMLYIGEAYGGCTADDSFFNAVAGHQITDDKVFNKIVKSFVQFSGLHDLPELYLKK